MTPLLLIGALGPALPGIVKSVESLFPAKTGTTKLDVAVAMVSKVASALATGGILPGAPDDKTVRDAVEATVQQLNLTGALKGAATQVSAAPYQELAQDLIASAQHNLTIATRLLGSKA
jgi:hypothetical protein